LGVQKKKGSGEGEEARKGKGFAALFAIDLYRSHGINIYIVYFQYFTFSY
jgi:hypothetical protein